LTLKFLSGTLAPRNLDRAIAMSDIRFACPRCQQHIQAEPAYAGREIACPACSAKMVVPGQPVMQLSAAPPVPVPVPAGAAASTASGGCPACGAPLARGTVICSKCGYNIATKQRVGGGRVAAAGRGKVAAAGEAKWYATAYPYIGVVLVILAVLYFLGRENPPMMLAFLLAAALYYVVVHIMVLVAAFRQSVGTGFLTLCVPFYALYFVLKVSESQTLKALYSFAILIGLFLKFFKSF